MKITREKSLVVAGLFLALIGVFFNKWFLEYTIVPDGNLTAKSSLTVVFFQLVLIGGGLLVLVKRHSLRLPSWSELALVGISVAMAILIGEVGIRVILNAQAEDVNAASYSLVPFSAPATIRYAPHHYLSYYLTPNYQRGPTSHNSLGFRGPDISPSKRDGSFRIAVIGGSSVYTSGVADNDKTFPAQLERVLREDYDAGNVTVINAGVHGYNSWESLINLQFRVLDLDPDLVIVYQGTNDVHTRLVEPSAYQSDNSGRRKPWEAPAFSKLSRSALYVFIGARLGIPGPVALGQFVDAPTAWYLEGDPQETLASNPPVYFQRNLRNMAAVTREHEVRIMFSTWAHSSQMEDYASLSHYQQGFRENNQVVAGVASSHQLPLFDFAAAMPQDPKYWADGRHVNAEGALLKAQLFAEYIVQQKLIN